MAAESEGAASETKARTDVRTIALPAGLTRNEDASLLVVAAVGRFGRLDILIGSARAARGAVGGQLTDEDWRAALRLNFLGQVRPIRAGAVGFGAAILVWNSRVSATSIGGASVEAPLVLLNEHPIGDRCSAASPNEIATGRIVPRDNGRQPAIKLSKGNAEQATYEPGSVAE